MNNFLLVLALVASTAVARTEAIRAHMTFLASDLLEGRGTGTRGYRIAAEYVAAQYELAGLEPAANGSWYQEVPFRETVPDGSSTMTFTRDGAPPVTLRNFDGFTSYGDPLTTDKVIEGDVVFAGYGISAPDQKYDDYAGLDVRGKVVAIFGSAPARFPNAVRAHYSSSLNKIETAAAKGAVGLITLTSPEDEARYPWERKARQTRIGSMHWLRPDGTPNAVDPKLSSTAGISLEATRQLFGAQAEAVFESLEDGKPKPQALRTRVRMELKSTHRKLTSPNVVGVVRGSDPKLRDEYLVYSAHLDHVGITAPVDGDTINNGAFDNASGIAVMLEIARAWAALEQKPKRSVIFLATTAEEKGLRGADYFANNPTVPVEWIIGNINIDMLVMIARTSDLVPIGLETNEIGDVARDVAKEMNIELTPDPFPEEVVFVRSDQYPFIRRGIPALYVDPGYKAVDPSIDLPKLHKEWLRTRYHAPSDDLKQQI
ncbi:MAG TPA: M28 family metallopeptidase, partial [Thermoanaerobaculia bacterium]|nr:M28 family metallopeptidase [Thermoanaerobaculia bacterium]